MEVVVKLFGPMSRVVGGRQVTVRLDVGESTCAALRARLVEREPRLAPMVPACRFAVNQRLVGDDHVLRAGDEVALVGLVSGG